ncbi:hypothetical protein B0J14DRAFT_562732 [Halenospora varia]|nr:hypothetical protein B0J14DRAFT_562732 [Halenospora varia]
MSTMSELALVNQATPTWVYVVLRVRLEGGSLQRSEGPILVGVYATVATANSKLDALIKEFDNEIKFKDMKYYMELDTDRFGCKDWVGRYTKGKEGEEYDVEQHIWVQRKKVT